MAYTKRYGAGFNDLGIPGATPADSQYLNAVETSLLRLDAVDPTVDGQVMQWVAASSRFGPALLLNKNIDPAAAIDKSKLNLTGQIVNADISASASIAKSKLAALSIVDADVSSISAAKITGLAAAVTAIPFAPVSGNPIATLSNAFAETDLFGTAGSGFSLTGGSLGTAKKLVIEAYGDLQNTSGINNGFGFTPKLYYGATSVTGDTVLVNTSGSNRFAWTARMVIKAQGATNSQLLNGAFLIGGAGGNQIPVLGFPALGASGVTLAAVDSTVAQNVRLTATGTGTGNMRTFGVDFLLVG